MKKEGIRSIIVTKFRPQSCNGTVVERTNHLEQDFTTTTINQKWVADITYINTLRDGWYYLASVLDLHTKKIVGYSFSRSMTTELVLRALHNAVTTQDQEPVFILHTDLGSPYTSEVFEKAVTAYGIKQSFSRKGCPYDVVCIGSFHAILKNEEVHQVRYLDYESARVALFRYIEG